MAAAAAAAAATAHTIRFTNRCYFIRIMFRETATASVTGEGARAPESSGSRLKAPVRLSAPVRTAGALPPSIQCPICRMGSSVK